MKFTVSSLRAQARKLKIEVHAVYLAARDPRVPRIAKLVAACVGAYALSPIDLIPDFIPVLGALDDLVILPIGIALALRLVPAEIMDECRARAAAHAETPDSRAAALVIVLIWTVLAVPLGAAVVLAVR